MGRKDYNTRTVNAFLFRSPPVKLCVFIQQNKNASEHIGVVLNSKTPEYRIKKYAYIQNDINNKLGFLVYRTYTQTQRSPVRRYSPIDNTDMWSRDSKGPLSMTPLYKLRFYTRSLVFTTAQHYIQGHNTAQFSVTKIAQNLN